MTEPSSVDLALQDPPVLHGKLSPGFFASLGERVEAALMAPHRDSLNELCQGIQRLLDLQLREASEGLRVAVSGETEADTSDANTDAANLGRLAFALQLLSQAVQKRAPEDLVTLIRAEPYAPYVQALGQGERTNAELREMYGEAAETVSRKLRILRDSGVTDFRKEGRRIVNFLTPAAWACVDHGPGDAAGTAVAVPAVEAEMEADDSVRESRAIALSSLKRKLTPQFSEQPIIQGSDPEQRVYRHG